jgi:hypothetical protein
MPFGPYPRRILLANRRNATVPGHARFPGFSMGGQMPAYRAYQLDNRHRILSGQWLEAPNDALAIDQAEELCEEGVPAIELWQSTRLVDEIECADGEDCPCES